MTADLASRIQQQLAGDLHTDERVCAAIRVNAVGEKALSAWLADLEPADALPRWGERHPDGVPQPTPADTPIGYLLVVSDRRVLVVRRSVTGRAKGVVVGFSADDLTVDAVDRGGKLRVRRFVLGLGGDEVLVADAPINGDAALAEADAFASAAGSAPISG